MKIIASPNNLKQLIKIDKTDADNIYIGYAKIGTAAATAGWQISKLTTVSSVLTLAFADGNTRFDNVWNDRATYSYS